MSESESDKANFIGGLLDGKGFVSVELVSPSEIPPENDGTFSPDRTRDYIIAKAARASTGMGMKLPKDDKNLIKYLIRHNHTSPLEMASITFCIKCPISIGRQLLRHRTARINEFSQRYSEVTDEMGRMDMRTKECIRSQSKMNAQSSDPLPPEKHGAILKKLEEVEGKLDDLFKDYEELRELGLTREVARFCLPQSTYTVLYYQLDMNNFRKFSALRRAPDAQYEIQVYANAMFELAKKYFPIVTEAIEEESQKMVLDKWAIQMIKEKRIPDELKSKSRRTALEELSKELGIELSLE